MTFKIMHRKSIDQRRQRREFLVIFKIIDLRSDGLLGPLGLFTVLGTVTIPSTVQPGYQVYPGVVTYCRLTFSTRILVTYSRHVFSSRILVTYSRLAFSTHKRWVQIGQKSQPKIQEYIKTHVGGPMIPYSAEMKKCSKKAKNKKIKKNWCIRRLHRWQCLLVLIQIKKIKSQLKIPNNSK